MRIDAVGLLFHMPVDHDTTTTIPDVPFGHEVLIPRPEFLGVRGTGGRSLAPDTDLSHTKDGIRDLSDGRSERFLLEKPPVDIAQFVVRDSVITREHSRHPCVGSQGIEAP